MRPFIEQAIKRQTEEAAEQARLKNRKWKTWQDMVESPDDSTIDPPTEKTPIWPYNATKPFRIVLSGKTGCGKTFWLGKRVMRGGGGSEGHDKTSPFREIWIFAPPQSIKQDVYRLMAEWADEQPETHPVRMEYSTSLPNEDEGKRLMDRWRNDKKPRLIIFDDFLSDMEGPSGNKFVQNCFTGGRHIDLSIAQLVQNPFVSGSGRTERLNASWLNMGLFPDFNSIANMFSQTLPKEQRDQAMADYQEVIKKKGGHVTIDLDAPERSSCILRDV